MSDTYFEYTLLQCRSQKISNVCSRFSIRKRLLDSISEEWGGYNRIIRDYELMDAVDDIFRFGEITKGCGANEDFSNLYSRCESDYYALRRAWKNREGLDYDRLFDALVELCWLIASAYNSNQSNNRYIVLLDNRKQIVESVKLYLDDLYANAIQDHNESVYIAEAIRHKKEHTLAPSFFDSQYPQSDWYIREGWTTKALEYEQQNFKTRCSLQLAQYYGLTATAALADNIGRGLC